MSQELRDLAKKVMEKVELAVNREDEAFKKALAFIQEEIKAILGDEGDDSVGEAQSPNPTVAAPIWGQMGGPQPANATSPNAPMRTLGEENPDYSEQMPGNGQPELEEGQEPSASIPNAQQPITAEHVAAIGNYGAAATSGLGAEMAHSADSDAQPEDSATTIQGDEKPEPAPEPAIVGGEGSTPDAGEDAPSEPLPSEQAIAGADAGTAVGEQKDAEAGGSPDSGPLADAASDSDKSASATESPVPDSGLPTGGNSPETAPLAPEGDSTETPDLAEDATDSDASDEDSETDSDGTDSDSDDTDEDVGSDEGTSSTAPKKRGRPKKKA